ncbi:hypothetical protein OUZ56_008930 [Daphnia magna]|uniref:Uncharacterized protein n=1 Tax=Daphnia magna TaxID=35525 RepID=A0ABR0AEG3_9CRUS|nr:hypothetical protein OUZ56_008930 [Daphnia magna]
MCTRHFMSRDPPNLIFFFPSVCAIPFLLFFIIQKNHWGLMGFLIRLIRNEQRRVRAHTRFRMPSGTWSGEDDRILTFVSHVAHIKSCLQQPFFFFFFKMC